MRSLIAACVIAALLSIGAIHAASFGIFQASIPGSTFPNANSPLGTNLDEPFANGSTAENAFLNTIVYGGGWYTVNSGGTDTGEENILYASCLSPDHYWITSPCPGTTFFGIEAIAYSNQHTFLYPSGNFVLMWDGNANATFTTTGATDPVTITTGCGLTFNSTTYSNRQIWLSSAPSVGVGVVETSIGTGGNPPKNIRFIYAGTGATAGDVGSTCSTVGTREALYDGGKIFDPQFIAQMKYYRLARMMKWAETLIDPTVVWANRPQPTWVFWNEGEGGTNFNTVMQRTGIPIEVQIALCNEIHADCWFNSPFLANDTYITNFATLALSGGTDTSGKFWPGLNASLKVTEEVGNEWQLDGNVLSSIFTAGAAAGQAAFPCLGNYPNNTAACPTPNPGSSLSNWRIYDSLRTAKAADLWNAVWTGGNSARLTTILGGQQGNPSFATFAGGTLDTDYGGVVCSGCSGNTWSGTVASRVNAVTSASYNTTNWGGCPYAWTADIDGGEGRCTTEYVTGGLLATSGSSVTTTHTTSSANACSVATGLSANHYSATVGGLTVTNGSAAAITFDTPTIGPCDDITINGTLGSLQQAFATIIKTNGGDVAGISSTTLTISNGNTNMPQCCGPQVAIGSQIVGSGTSANTFITAFSGSGSGVSGTYPVNNSQSVTCNPCYATNPLDAPNSDPVPGGIGCGQGTHCSSGPWLMVFTNATSGGSMPPSWRVSCSGGGCFEPGAGGWVAQIGQTIVSDIAAYASAFPSLKYVQYEGDPTGSSPQHTDELATMWTNLNQDANGGTIQTAYYNVLKPSGINGVVAHFTHITTLLGSGAFFGLLQSSRQTAASSPRFTATTNYIQAQPCWWSGCAIPP